MKSMRILSATSAACGVALALAGTALASNSNAAITVTGPNSTQTEKIDNSVDFTTVNFNDSALTNVNDQSASTGNVVAADNTVVGGAGSGNAVNNNGTSTSVQNNNAAASPVVNVAQPGSGASTGTTTVVGTKPAGVGSVLGASTVAAPAILPVTGATVPVDVSALRAAWHAPSSAPTTALVKQTQGLTTGMLGVATLFSLLGGLGSVLYGRRKEGRV